MQRKTNLQIVPVVLDLVSISASQGYVERAFLLCGDLCARKRNRACHTRETGLSETEQVTVVLSVDRVMNR